MENGKKCEADTAKGQCENYVIRDHDGIQQGNKCFFHGGWRTLKNKAKKVKSNYYLGKYQERVQDLATSPQVKSLREEIGILRMLLEVKVNSLENSDEFEFLKAVPVINDLISRIEALVASCVKIETNIGLTLDKNQIALLADAVVEVLSLALKDTSLSEDECSDLLQKVTNGIARAISPEDKSGTSPEVAD